MAFPVPDPGLVIRYSYLWADEYARGQEEGVKDRPCAVVLTSIDAAGDQIVTVLPITHTPPTIPQLAVEIPAAVKRRLGLDDERSWIVLTEANRFIWPGPDLRPLRSNDAASVAYGPLPYKLFEEVRLKFIAALKSRQSNTVPRTE
ncbi:MAG: type II toxin-antitoxin system PemK/MazF family toxin [Rhodospirillales bacterium]|nr:type II toxin-antitoxin system PemK/MazF family toxin [Rhodospirillales bacterium]